MFEPFVTTKAKGTGLGLSIARRIVEQHGGNLTGETHVEGGAVFRIVLPLVSKPANPA
jgi:two-component system, LuxR family, sensor kinase FixL